MGDADRPDGFVVPSTWSNARLVDIVRRHLVTVASREIGPLIARGAITVDRSVGAINDLVSGGATLTLDPAALTELDARGRVTPVHRDRDVPVVLRDADLLVLDKPSGMHVHPMGRHRDATLVGVALWHAGARPGQPWADARPLPAHRLDRATSGLVLFVMDPALLPTFQDAMSEGSVTRTYHARVVGSMRDDNGVIDAPLGRDPHFDYRRAVVPTSKGGQAARTHWRVLDRGAAETLLEVTLETGRTHQIRAHLASIGHRVVGDDLYDPAATGASAATTSIALRAVRLAFPHPRSGVSVVAATTPALLP